MPRQRQSYAWALLANELDGSIRQLSDDAWEGLDYAQALAQDARNRAEAALRREPWPAPLTARELGEMRRVSESTVRARIRLARREFFGELSDSGIYYRLRRQRELKTRPQRRCIADGCEVPLPSGATVRRRYCHEHADSAARVRRHRAARHHR